MPKFGRSSSEKLSTACIELQNICNQVIKIYDFSVIEGFRTKDRQNQLFSEGKSKVQFPNSKHNKNPSDAIDIVPYPVDWQDDQRFFFLAGLMFQEAKNQGVKLRWGGDWRGEYRFKENRFKDLPHFEVVRT
jgi:peptidoglycan L-alanyl-D-glutamate endopeptidase CwlK